jgi:poly(A) polymerase
MTAEVRGRIAGGLAADDLLGRVVSSLDPLRYDEFFVTGEYLLELATGFPPAGIMIVCARECAPAADRIARSTGLSALHLDDGVVNLSARGSRSVTLAPMEGADIASHLSGAAFTALALALDLSTAGHGGVEDPTGGIGDIGDGVLRALPGAIRDEPARCLLAARLLASFGLQPDAETALAMRSAAPLLSDIPGSRAWSAIAAACSKGRLSSVAAMLEDTGALGSLFPEVQAICPVPQNYYHHQGVWGHTLETLDRLQEIMDRPATTFKSYGPRLEDHLARPLEAGVTRRSFLAFAGLIHDVGKAATMTVEPSGRIRFQGHAIEGAALAGRIARRLGLGHKGRDHLSRIVRDHMRLGYLIKEGESCAGRLRAVDELGDHCVEVVMLSLADRLATRGEASTDEALERYGRVAKRVLSDHFWQIDFPPLVDGRDVMVHTGLPGGPEVGDALFGVRVAQREGSVANRAQALEYLAPDFKGKMDTRGT